HVAAGALSPERETIHICTEGVSMVLYPGRGTADLRGCTLPRRVVLGGEIVLDRDHQVALISEFAQLRARSVHLARDPAPSVAVHDRRCRALTPVRLVDRHGQVVS